MQLRLTPRTARHPSATGDTMTTAPPKRNPAEIAQETERQEAGLLEAVVRDNVLSALGRPAGPHRVQVTRVWGDSYRVNVFVGPDAASFTVAHSYFLRADGNGKILACCPPIARAY
jgi:hypothetical protein